MRSASLLSALVGAALFALVPTAGYADTLHGYCAGVGQCVDNGTNSSTNVNPPSNFGFTTSPGPPASYIVGFFSEAGGIQATANSGAIFETTSPVPVPGP